MIPVGTLLRLEERFHTYQMIVLARFPVFFNNEPLWHYELNFFRDGSNLGTLAFDEIELNKVCPRWMIYLATILMTGCPMPFDRDWETNTGNRESTIIW